MKLHVLSLAVVGLVSTGISTIQAAPPTVTPGPSTSVQVTNTTSNPVPVTGNVQINNANPVPVSVQGTIHEPYQQLIFVLPNSGDTRCTAFGCDIPLPPIPTGKRLVVQYVSAAFVTKVGFTVVGTLRTPDFDATSVRIQLIPHIQPLEAQFQLVAVSQPVTGYVFAGQNPYFQFGTAGAGMNLDGSVEVSLSGYLETVQ